MPPTKPSGSIPVSSGRGSSQGWSDFVDGEEAELLGPVVGPGVAGKRRSAPAKVSRRESGREREKTRARGERERGFLKRKP